MKKVVFIIILIISVFILCACSQKTAEEATADLKDSLYVDFELIEEKTDGDESVYTFRDESGIEFHYESRLIRAFSFSTLFARTFNRCDYSAAYVETYKDEIDEILSRSGLDYTYISDIRDTASVDWKHFAIIRANCRDDVTKAADTVAEIINAVGEVPMYPSGSLSLYPYGIVINCDPTSEYYSAHYDYCQNFMFRNYEDFDRDQLYYHVLYDYVNSVRDGKTEGNDLTDSDYVTCPARKAYITYEDTDIEEIYFTCFRGEYSVDFYDIMPSKSHIFDDFSFAETCEKMGIPCESTVTGLKWTIGENEYYSEYSKKHKVMKIYKNNEEICTLPCEALELREQSYVVTVTPDDFALMLDCKYKIDYKLGRIYFNAN